MSFVFNLSNRGVVLFLTKIATGALALLSGCYSESHPAYDSMLMPVIPLKTERKAASVASITSPESTSSLAKEQPFFSLTMRPDPLLNRMSELSWPDGAEWKSVVDEFLKTVHPFVVDCAKRLAGEGKITSERTAEIERQYEKFAQPVTGQRIVELLETACYADMVCADIEFPLRNSTFRFIKERHQSTEVVTALNWIRTSYRCRIELDSPIANKNDEFFRKLFNDGMEQRLRSWANSLLEGKDGY